MVLICVIIFVAAVGMAYLIYPTVFDFFKFKKK